MIDKHAHTSESAFATVPYRRKKKRYRRFYPLGTPKRRFTPKIYQNCKFISPFEDHNNIYIVAYLRVCFARLKNVFIQK